MPRPTADPSEILDDLLADYIPLTKLAIAAKRSDKTIRRWIDKLGLPFIKVGSERWIHAAKAREIMTGRASALPPTRGRGRPRKTLAVHTTKSAT